ncbi:MAG: hypothetical protein C0494_15790 [Sphingobium sp.]|nr:hypothetical protein [Sphingobium sp.]
MPVSKESDRQIAIPHCSGDRLVIEKNMSGFGAYHAGFSAPPKRQPWHQSLQPSIEQLENMQMPFRQAIGSCMIHLEGKQQRIQ